MRLLLLGGTGQVGQELRTLDIGKNVEVFAPSRFEFDLRDSRSIKAAINAGPWNAVINAAGFTDVDLAESQSESAAAINVEGPTNLAMETGRRGIPLIHISTDYVFDGCKGAPYLESDATLPLNVYGRTKLAGEHAVSNFNPRHIVLRTSWVYSKHRKNFVKTILRLSAERARLSVVDDQRGCPTAAGDVAKACRDIAMWCASAPAEVPYGVYHLTGEGEASWFEFAKVIVDIAMGRMGRVPQVVPIQTIDYPTPAVRPKDTRLNCEAIVRGFGIKLRPWRDGLEETINQLVGDNL